MFDLIVRNAVVVDGTGAPRRRADVAVEGGCVRQVGSLPPDAQAAEVVDAAGMVLSPGFVDLHTHSDIALLARREHLPAVMQGVTTEAFTNCGVGFAPASDASLAVLRPLLMALFGADDGVDWSFRSVADLLAAYERVGTAVNVAYLIPHGAVRVMAMGTAPRAAADAQRAQMVALVREGVEQGARGLSTGPWYPPMDHADRRELVELCRAAGFFAIHQRDYNERLFEATDEALEIADEAGIPVQLSHLQMGTRANAGRAAELVEHIAAARARGIDVAWDSYPYTAGSTMIQAMLPQWANAGGPDALRERLLRDDDRARIEADLAVCGRDWDRTLLIGVEDPRNRAIEGHSFTECARARGMPVPQFIAAVLIEEDLRPCYVGHHTEEEDLEVILRHELQMVASDGLHLPGMTHPRLRGCFPRVLARYVRERGVLTLEEAVRKMTSAPAARLNLKDRGVLREGAWADMVLFDPDTVRDTATYTDPFGYPEGISDVWVNGTAVKRHGERTAALPGRVLRKGCD